MSDPVAKITREELHHLVWTRPFVRLAEELGYSYNELAAICSALNIPRPSGGYWYRQTHGGAEDPTPLPPAEPGSATEMPFGTRGERASEPVASAPPQPQAPVTSTMETATPQKEKQKVKNALTHALRVASKSYEPVRVTREVLYQKVWQMTLAEVAAELDTTPGEIKAACVTLQIPKPDTGYWTWRRNELPYKIPPLPKADQGTPAETMLRRRGAPKPKPEPPTSGSAKAEPAAPTVPLPTKVDYTRQQLYEAVWSKAGVKLAPELGLSDVGLAKTCRRMGIPRPPRGYRARIAAGEKLRRPELPAIKPGQNAEVTFYVAANVERREEWARNRIPSGMAGVRCAKVELPPPGAEVHPIAERHRLALEKAKPKELGFVSVDGKNLFRCEMSASMVPLFVPALDALLCELEDRDYEFKPSKEDYRSLRVCRDKDDLTLEWSEAKLEIEREPTAEEKRKPSWTWQLKEIRPDGELSIEVSALGLKGKRKWTSGDGRTLEEVLGIIVEKIEAVFRGFETQRQREAELAKQRAEAAKRREEEEAREAKRRAKAEEERKERERAQRHQKKLEAIAEARRNNLLAAMHDWMDAQGARAFVGACEQRWRQAGGGSLSPRQAEWLTWAKAELEKMEPFAIGYPDPALDGSFPASEVPAGGPYPETRKWPKREKEKPEAKANPPEPQRSPMLYPNYYSTGWKY